MKRLFLGLFVAIVALSTSAFTNAQSLKSGFATYTFYQVADGQYSITNPGTSCSNPTSTPCSYQITTTDPDFTSVSSFNAEDLDQLLIDYSASASGVGLNRYYN